jgi:hypothetical protein
VTDLFSEPFVLVLAPSVSAVAARESGRAKSAYAGDGPSIALLDHALRAGTPRLGLWLDTSDQLPEETVDEIVSRHPEALVRGRDAG